MSSAAACGCVPGEKRCPEAAEMWDAANVIYRAKGYEAWLQALEPYNEHNAQVDSELLRAPKP